MRIIRDPARYEAEDVVGRDAFVTRLPNLVLSALHAFVPTHIVVLEARHRWRMTASAAARPHILVLTTTLPAREGDGTPAFVLDLAQALSADNDITILAPRVPDSAAHEHLGNVEIKRFPYFPKRLRASPTARSCRTCK